jgi:hypothetical protein
MPARSASRRGGPRPGSGRPKVPIERDPDRFFVVIWRVLFQLLGYSPREAGYFAAFLTSAEPITLSQIEGGVLRVAGTTVKHHANTLERRITSLVEKAKASSDTDPWLERSQIAVESLVLAALWLARPNLSNGIRERLPTAARILIGQLRELGWADSFGRLEARISAVLGSNLPPHDGPLGRGGRRLLRLLKEPSTKKS